MTNQKAVLNIICLCLAVALGFKAKCYTEQWIDAYNQKVIKQALKDGDLVRISAIDTKCMALKGWNKTLAYNK